MPAPFRLYNTLTSTVEDYVPQTAGHVGLYVCGMTVYDRCHVGHARAMVVFDSFVRYLRHRDWSVRFVRNFTDVDDKIIRRAAEAGENPMALSARYIDAFREDASALGLLTPDEEPQVSTSIDDIVRMIGGLVDNGAAYAENGNVWYAVESFSEYGKLSGQRVEELRSADSGDAKRHPADFALWKAAKPGEPSWESPWGAGRPGWHIECSAMSTAALGDTLDIHGGGLDLVFPHHENEIAQAEACTGHPYARYWMHNGLLTMSSGQKMGKSLGNVIDVKDALASYPAEVLRLYYLQSHYRSALPWGEAALGDALVMAARLYEAREVASELGGTGDPDAIAKEIGADALDLLHLASRFKARFHAALDDDFNTAKALGALFELARAINRLSNHKLAKKQGGPVAAMALPAFELVTQALGFMAQTPAAFFAEVASKQLAAIGVTPAQVEALIAERAAARAAKDWPQADVLRDQLTAWKVDVRDGADGVVWRVRV